jgi:hypothetical protein
LILSPLLAAQLSLRNADVIKLVKAGLDEDLIITTINASPGDYDTSASGLAALKSAGVSDKEFSAIIQRAFHICLAGTDRDRLQGLRLGQMVQLLQEYRCGPRHSNVTQAAYPDAGLAASVPAAQSVNKPRVFFTFANKGVNLSTAQNQSIEMSHDFERECPAVQITMDRVRADYKVSLYNTQNGHASASRMQITDRDGDFLSKVEGGESIDERVKQACNVIVADWTGK